MVASLLKIVTTRNSICDNLVVFPKSGYICCIMYLHYHKQLRSLLIVSRIITWGLTRMMKDLRSTYVDRAIDSCNVERYQVPTHPHYNTAVGINNT